jgi:putative endonuclease
MSETRTLGQKGEDIAAAYLKDAGYKIRHRNWISGKREIDIVAENNDYVVFVEVKTRSEGFLVHPKDAVTNDKQRSMIHSAESYIRKYDIDKESRFDIITIIVKAEKFEIEQHIEGAFYPTLK